MGLEANFAMDVRSIVDQAGELAERRELRNAVVNYFARVRGAGLNPTARRLATELGGADVEIIKQIALEILVSTPWRETPEDDADRLTEPVICPKCKLTQTDTSSHFDLLFGSRPSTGKKKSEDEDDAGEHRIRQSHCRWCRSRHGATPSGKSVLRVAQRVLGLKLDRGQA